MADQPERKQPGPEPERLKIDGDWEDAIRRALKVKRPPDGWPDPDERNQANADDENDDG